MAKTWAAGVGITLDPRADVAIGVQLDWSIRAAVAAGRLKPGERFPALRDLAQELGVNHNTVRAAVAKLEAEGLLETRHGTGTFVASGAAAHERHAPLVEQAKQWAADAGLSPRELAAALYVADAAPPKADPAAEARRALRDEIAMLERLIARLETGLPERLPPEDAAEPRTRGARLLSTGELEAKRDSLVRRLAAVQRAVDGDDGVEEPAVEPEREKAPAPAPRRAPRPGIAPA
jgi:DNA-binding transcriptional regulator YhcF (GntR family)